MGVGEAGIPSEEPQNIIASITGNDRLQNALPVISTVHVAIAKEASFHIPVLIEAEEWMITGALKVSVVSRAFLITVGRADRTVHIENDLRRYGERLIARGGPGAKRKAVVAVARKLAVLLHRLWSTGEVYQRLYNA